MMDACNQFQFLKSAQPSYAKKGEDNAQASNSHETRHAGAVGHTKHFCIKSFCVGVKGKGLERVLGLFCAILGNLSLLHPKNAASGQLSPTVLMQKHVLGHAWPIGMKKGRGQIWCSGT